MSITLTSEMAIVVIEASKDDGVFVETLTFGGWELNTSNWRTGHLKGREAATWQYAVEILYENNLIQRTGSSGQYIYRLTKSGWDLADIIKGTSVEEEAPAERERVFGFHGPVAASIARESGQVSEPLTSESGFRRTLNEEYNLHYSRNGFWVSYNYDNAKIGLMNDATDGGKLNLVWKDNHSPYVDHKP